MALLRNDGRVLKTWNTCFSKILQKRSYTKNLQTHTRTPKKCSYHLSNDIKQKWKTV